MIDTDMLKDAQRQGWNILSVEVDHIVAGCPRAGCALKATFRAGKKIPATCRPQPEFQETVIDGYESFRLFMRLIRERYMLTISDVEECAGFQKDRLAKCEKDDPSKVPNIIDAIEWAQTLGIEIIARPAPLPVVTLRTIEQTRAQLGFRRAQKAREMQRRVGGSASAAGS